MNYNVQKIEKKWQQYWKDNPVGQTKSFDETQEQKKFYCLDMFPYPSGSGLHVGHWRGYVLSDVYTRIKWLEGYNILHPMGWDAFGLPAENDAIKKGIHPAVGTARNIANFKEQLQSIAALYDWSKEINTTDPGYYKWTQWIFLKMYKAGLAYESYLPINWCPSCLTGLANEEVVEDLCDRCSAKVEQKQIRQWVLKITEYAEKLLSGLDTLNWPEKVKTMQRNWIGKSQGAQVDFQARNPDTDKNINFSVYTTRPETLFGVTFLVLAPDHELVSDLLTENQKQAVADYLKEYNAQALQKPAQDTGSAAQSLEKTGVATGSYAIHPLTKEQLPIFISNYVLKDYGTGIVMGVPAHDQRDFDFAQKFNVPIKQVIVAPPEYKDDKDILVKAYSGDGPLINSAQFNTLDAQVDGQEAILKYLVENKLGELQVRYKLRDWIFSRQRYWGEPIPLIHCTECGIVPVPEDQLPVKLPDVENYKPSGTGESPLATIEWWVNVSCPQCKGPAKRETNTMPQWAGSCWYFLRYPNPNLHDKPWSQEDMHYWLPVDLYVGGIEHAILHLLYARFYVKVLYDLGYLPFNEPFAQLFNQGMINKYSEKSGAVEKMSKSKGNVVNPDDIVDKYGSDALRMYILFMGPPELDVEWQDSGLEGVKRFLQKLWNYFTNPEMRLKDAQEKPAVTHRVHRFIKEFQERIAVFKPNTALSAFMEFINDAIQHKMQLSDQSIENILVVLSVMAPHMASELLLSYFDKYLQDCSWPCYDPALAESQKSTIVIQVNGKTRNTIVVDKDVQQEEIQNKAKQAIERWLLNKSLVKVIYIPHKLINFIIK